MDSAKRPAWHTNTLIEEKIIRKKEPDHVKSANIGASELIGAGSACQLKTSRRLQESTES